LTACISGPGPLPLAGKVFLSQAVIPGFLAHIEQLPVEKAWISWGKRTESVENAFNPEDQSILAAYG
jgi:hypothetical protein